jgi:hypothetical protein
MGSRAVAWQAIMREMTRELESATWAVAEGRATGEQLALFQSEPGWSLRMLQRLIDDTDDALASVRGLPADERDQVVSDFEEQLASLIAIQNSLVPTTTADGDAPATKVVGEVIGEVRLQASWSEGRIVVWAAGPGTSGSNNADLADRLEAIGGPAVGWTVCSPVLLPSGVKADALAIPLKGALGWLIAVAGGLGRTGVGQSVVWLARVALEGVRLVSQGAVVPTLRFDKRPQGRVVDAAVRWVPALVDDERLKPFVSSMPGPVAMMGTADARAIALSVLSAAVEAVVTEAAGRLELPAPPPSINNSLQLAETFTTRLNGTPFVAPTVPASDLARRMGGWTGTVTSFSRPKLILQLEPPDHGNAWHLSVLGPGAKGKPMPIEVALGDSRDTKPLADELTRLERAYPVLKRAGELRRGQVVLSQSEAWELMTVTGSQLAAAGFDVRVPALSRRKPSPSLRLFADIGGESVVGAHQLANVSWSVLFDDVELTAAEIAKLASEARPLVRSHGKWVELDRVDLKEAAAALAERASTKQLTGAEILRHGIGLEGSPLAGGITIEGSGWATELFQRAKEFDKEPVTRPPGFDGELRSYQAQALAWLGFLDAAELGGCLALDMGLGKTPTILAHLARTRDDGPALVVAPPAVVGNWAREAARFTPGLHVLVHHGASRYEDDELRDRFKEYDVVITTYGTAVRDIDVLSELPWHRLVLDEAQAIKNPSNESAQQLRRIKAPSKIALTGTPVENGLGDLWAILDFTNPGLVGSRPAFIHQMQGEGEAALRALNGILVFRRTKSEPEVAEELPDKIDELDHCSMTPEQIGLYQAVLDGLVRDAANADGDRKQGAILAAITALKQICNHPAAYIEDDRPLSGRSGKLTRLEELVAQVFSMGEKILIFTHFASWGRKLATHLSQVTGQPINCYDGSLARGARDHMIVDFQERPGPGALVLSLKAGGTGLNLTAASHVVLYDRWWNPAVEDQARDRAWRIGQTRTVVSHRLVCPGTVDERVEEVVAGKRHIADLVLPKSSSLADLDAAQLRVALGLRTDSLLTEDDE